MGVIINLPGHIRSLEEARDGWLELLNKSPNSVQNAEAIVRINAKLEQLRNMLPLGEAGSE